MDGQGEGSGAIERTERSVTRSGAAVTLEREDDVIRVWDPRGRLVFELRDGTTASIVAPAGDLELRADAGTVRLVGRDGVAIESRTISLRAERLVTAVHVLETHADRILERAKDVYRDVESLSQLRAGQVRIVAKKSFRALAERLRLKAKKDVGIDGERINLG